MSSVNYTPSSRNTSPLHPTCVANEICDFLDSIGEMFECQVTFSRIIPTAHHRMNTRLFYINESITAYCLDVGHNIFESQTFYDIWWGCKKFDRSQFAVDGIHLGRAGIESLATSLIKYISNAEFTTPFYHNY